MRIYIATFIRGELPTDMKENFLRTNFAKEWLAPIIRQGQANGEFREGDPEELADAFWFYILGVVANYIHNRNNTFEHAEKIVKVFHKPLAVQIKNPPF